MAISLDERIEQVQYIMDTYRPIPHMFVKDVLGAEPWDKQIEIIQAVFKYKTVAVKTCNAVGKSYIAARIALTYLLLYPDSIVVTTAPTWRQVTDVLWREIATAKKMARFELTSKDVTQAGLNLGTKWYAVGLSTKYPENFFGYHADNILVIVDEAGGVPEPIFKGVKAITPNAGARILYIGNPTAVGGTFHQAFINDKLPIKRFTISAFDSPNFTMTGIKTVDDLLALYTPPPGIEQAEWTAKVSADLQEKMHPVYRNALIDPATVYERYYEWGVDSPSWQALIMGEFPSQSDQALIPEDLVSAAMRMREPFDDTGKTYEEVTGWNIPKDGPPEYGIDMARYGSDNTVVFPRRGGVVSKAIAWNKISLMESADRIIGTPDENGRLVGGIVDPLDPSARVNIDDTGNGGGTTDRLRQLSDESFKGGQPAHQYHIAAYNFSTAPRDPKFADITSELYWNLRDWFMKKRISLPDDKQLYAELISRQWGLTTTGKIKVESKDDYRKRTGAKSPDKSDALALAFAGNIREHATPVAKNSLESLSVDDVFKPVTSGLLSRY